MSERKPLQDRVVLRAFLGVVLALIVDVILHGRSINFDWDRLWTLLTMLIAFLFAIMLEQRNIPARFKRLRNDMVEAANAAEQNGLLDQVLLNAWSDFERRLLEVRQFTYTDAEGRIPQLSLDTIGQVKSQAFATFVADSREKIYIDESGRQYLEAWYQKAEELKEESKSERLSPICRVFVTNQLGDLTEETFELIQKHLNKRIDVHVIERKIAERLRQGCELDFALFDDSCLMTVKPLSDEISQLSVRFLDPSHLNLNEIVRYQAFKSRLLKHATPGKRFVEEFSKPMNAEFWDRKMGNSSDVRLDPPHGLSQLDAKNMVEMAVEACPDVHKSLRVAVLGMTPQLIEACTDNPRVGEIHLIDQTRVVFPASKTPKNCKLEHSNWLDLKNIDAYDAILGDEALNNLALKQYREFFRVMRASLTSRGILILRTLGRFDEADTYLKTPAVELLTWIQGASATLSDLERGAGILAFLHSGDIAFDQSDSLIKTKHYNDLLSAWVREGKLTAMQAAPFFFPAKENPNLRLSSPTSRQLEDAANQHFSRMTFQRIDDSYSRLNSALSELYRITPFTPPE